MSRRSAAVTLLVFGAASVLVGAAQLLAGVHWLAWVCVVVGVLVLVLSWGIATGGDDD
jgi:hypothetical protein